MTLPDLVMFDIVLKIYDYEDKDAYNFLIFLGHYKRIFFVFFQIYSI